MELDTDAVENLPTNAGMSGQHQAMSHLVHHQQQTHLMGAPISGEDMSIDYICSICVNTHKYTITKKY